jgi:opacity protein-like surface antigen
MKPLLSLWALTALLGVAMPASAQQMVPRAQVAGGYQALRFTDGTDQTFAKGWFVDVLGNITHHLGAVSQRRATYNSIDEPMALQGAVRQSTVDLTALEYMGGVRVSARPSPAVTPFAQVLVGGVRGSASVSASTTNGGHTFFQTTTGASTTDWGVQTGGGVNVFVTEQIGIRAGADYQRIFAESQGINVFRFVLGAVAGF